MTAEGTSLNFTDLPPETVDHVNYYLSDNQSQNNFTLTCSFFYGVAQARRLQNRLIKTVVEGKQEKAEKILQAYPELLLKRSTITDYSGRTFYNITAFEYALWALDVHYMVPMMIDCLPKDSRGEKIRKELAIQYQQLKNDGTHYRLEGKTYHEKHFNFSSLIESLKIYNDKFNQWRLNERNKHCQSNIKPQQQLVPAHVAQHFCEPNVTVSPESFDNPKFSRSLKYYNLLLRKHCYWFDSISDTTERINNFALIRGATLKGPSVWNGEGGPAAALIDLNNLKGLENKRMLEFAELEERLKEPLCEEKTESIPLDLGRSCCK